jgi:putative nucleotidyltransferase with HDIG domain
MTAVLADRPGVPDARRALADAGGVWIVGGAVRDALLGRVEPDLDLAVATLPVEQAARALASTVGGPAFPLSEQFGAWRVIGDGGAWVCDLSPLQGDSIEDDLAMRDFTVNAMAVPLFGGEIVDPHGGQADLEARRLRLVAADAYERDALRTLRLARLATELGFRPEPETAQATRAAAPAVVQASGERIFAELRRIFVSPSVVEGVELLEDLGLMRALLPEVDAMHGVGQNQFHHLDVHGHTLEVLASLVDIEVRLAELFPADAGRLAAQHARPLADDLTRGQALRLGALLHDIGKPVTRRINDSGGVSFIGHDDVGASMAEQICGRLRTSDKLRQFVSGVTRHHLALGFLVHEQPLQRRTVYRYLRRCEPVEVEVTLLTCADRLATRGRNAEEAIEKHLELARGLMTAALDWREHGPPGSPVRGDELARELDIEPGPALGALLSAIEEATYAGEVQTRDQAIDYARRLRENDAG